MVFSKKFALTAVLVMTMAAGAIAQSDPIVARKAMMKSNGAAIGTLAKMAKGEAPFDAAAAKQALESLHGAAGFADLFPVGSDQGDTKAKDTIWSDNAGFKAALAKFIAAADAQAANPPKDVDGVKAALAAIGPTCQGCHQTYRKPQS